MFLLQQELPSLNWHRALLDHLVARVFDWLMREALAQPKDLVTTAGFIRDRVVNHMAAVSDLGPHDQDGKTKPDRTMLHFYILMTAVVLVSFTGLGLIAAGYTIALPAFVNMTNVIIALGAGLLFLGSFLVGLGPE